MRFPAGWRRRGERILEFNHVIVERPPDEPIGGRPGRKEVRERYSRLAGIYDLRWRRYVGATVRQTMARLPLGAGARVLDLGCGTGVLLEAIGRAEPSAALAGVDLSLPMLRVAAGRLGSAAALTVADVSALPLGSERFDLVVSTSSFRYWPDPRAALGEVRRVLAPGGGLVVTDWCDDFLACWTWDRILGFVDSTHRRAYGWRECERLLEESGFAVERVDRYKIDWLWGLMTARAIRR